MSQETTQKKTIDELELYRMSLGEGHPEIMLINQEIKLCKNSSEESG